MRIARVENGWQVTYSTGVVKRSRVFEDTKPDDAESWEERTMSLARALGFMVSRLVPTGANASVIVARRMKE